MPESMYTEDEYDSMVQSYERQLDRLDESLRTEIKLLQEEVRRLENEVSSLGYLLRECQEEARYRREQV